MMDGSAGFFASSYRFHISSVSRASELRSGSLGYDPDRKIQDSPKFITIWNEEQKRSASYRDDNIVSLWDEFLYVYSIDHIPLNDHNDSATPWWMALQAFLRVVVLWCPLSYVLSCFTFLLLPRLETMCILLCCTYVLEFFPFSFWLVSVVRIYVYIRSHNRQR